MFSPLHKIVVIVCLLFLWSDCFSQRINIVYDTNGPSERSMTSNWYLKDRKDSAVLAFEVFSFHKDTAEITINNQKFASISFINDSLWSPPKLLEIPKLKGKEKIKIRDDKVTFDTFILDKKYSFVYLGIDENYVLYVIYTNHRWIQTRR